MKTSLLLAVLLALPLPALAQVADPQPPPPECSAILATHVDDNLDPRIDADCDSTAYYYGIGRERDYTLARACAYIERFKHVDKDGSLFPGAGILSLIYANGQGVPANYDLARHFVCEIKEASPSETVSRLKDLDRMAQTPKNAGHFGLCATGVSGTTAGWCSSVDLRIHDTARYDVLVKLVDPLTPKQQDAFKVLQSAEQAFEESHVTKELDLTGTFAISDALKERDRLRSLFVSDFTLFNKPDFSEPVTLGVADSHIDFEYTAIQKNGPRIFRNTTLTVEGIDDTQAIWLKYVTAWRAYEAAVNPTISLDAVATQLDRERLYTLHKLATTF